MMKRNKILLCESSGTISGYRLRKYETIYVYRGDVGFGKKIESDILTLEDRQKANYTVGNIIDWVYEQCAGYQVSAVLNDAMGDERGYLFVKQMLWMALSRFYLSFTLAQKFIERYAINGPIDFLPDHFPYSLFAIVVNKKELFSEDIRIPDWYLKKMRLRESVLNKFYDLMLWIYPAALSLGMRSGKDNVPIKRRYRYGIQIFESMVDQSNFNDRLSYLWGDNAIDRFNTLHFMSYKMSKKSRRKVASLGYPDCYFGDMIHNFNRKQYFNVIYSEVRKLVAKMRKVKSNTAMVTEVYVKVIREFIRWKIFYSLYDIDTVIYLQDAGPIPQALFQKMYGSQRVFVYMSTEFDCVYRENMDTCIGPHYGYLMFDAMVSSMMSNERFKKNINFIDRYAESGVLLSDIVFQTRNNVELKAKIKKELGIHEYGTIIGFFDVAAGSNGYIKNVEGQRMLEDVHRLLDENPSYFLIYRSRAIQNIPKNSDLERAFKKLVAHKRVFYANELAPQYCAPRLIGVCDLVIGGFASSAVMESVAGGVRTICHIADKRFSKDCFVINSFPKFCVYNYKQLKEYSEYWLRQCTNEEFQEFQSKYIRKHIDGYCDGNATNRLYKFLSELNISRSDEKAQTVYGQIFQNN